MYLKFTHKNGGFSLLEILMVIVIIGIITSIAIPVYKDKIIKARRSEAQVTLLNLAIAMEHYYIEKHSYLDATIGAHGTVSTIKTTTNDYYDLNIEDLTATSYKLIATPINSQSSDTQCGSLSIDQLGFKMISGTGSVSQCW